MAATTLIPVSKSTFHCVCVIVLEQHGKFQSKNKETVGSVFCTARSAVLITLNYLSMATLRIKFNVAFSHKVQAFLSSPISPLCFIGARSHQLSFPVAMQTACLSPNKQSPLSHQGGWCTVYQPKVQLHKTAGRFKDLCLFEGCC